jgi:hypothetical protein
MTHAGIERLETLHGFVDQPASPWLRNLLER